MTAAWDSAGATIPARAAAALRRTVVSRPFSPATSTTLGIRTMSFSPEAFTTVVTTTLGNPNGRGSKARCDIQPPVPPPMPMTPSIAPAAMSSPSTVAAASAVVSIAVVRSSPEASVAPRWASSTRVTAASAGDEPVRATSTNRGRMPRTESSSARKRASGPLVSSVARTATRGASVGAVSLMGRELHRSQAGGPAGSIPGGLCPHARTRIVPLSTGLSTTLSAFRQTRESGGRLRLCL